MRRMLIIAAGHGHAMLWTGTELLVFCGAVGRLGRGAKLFNDGWSLDPEAGRWERLPEAPDFDGRATASAAWTGAEAILWGGEGEGPLRDGRRHVPARTR